MTALTTPELLRYSRQITLPQVGVNGQQQLKNASILCIGAGGIGSPVLLYLAAAGIGKIGIIDDDVIELSNLHRQVLYTTDHCGQSKVDIAKQQLLANNDKIQIHTYSERLNVNNAFDIISQYQIVIDGSDNYATRYLASDVCQINKITLISASLFQFSGQLLTLYYTQEDAACYRCLYPNPPPAGLMQNCADAGIIGSVAGILGTMAATQAIKVVLNADQNDKNKLFIFNGLNFELEKFSFVKRADCVLCAANAPFAQLPRHEENFCSNMDMDVKQITVAQLIDYQTKNILLVDVRSHLERNLGHIPNSIHIPMEDFSALDVNQANFQNKDAIILYCKSGLRSAHVAQLLQEKGLSNVYNLAGGIIAWGKIKKPEIAVKPA